MMNFLGMIFLPLLSIMGIVLLVVEIIDRNYQGLAIGGCIHRFQAANAINDSINCLRIITCYHT
jgi:hypothetical protein